MKYVLLLMGVSLFMVSCSENEYDVPGGSGDLLLVDGYYLWGEGTGWPELTKDGALLKDEDTLNIIVAAEAGAKLNITAVVGGEFITHGPGSDVITETFLSEEGDELWRMKGSIVPSSSSFVIENEGNYEITVNISEMTILIEELGAIPFDMWTVIGSAVGGWDEANDQVMDYDYDTNLYSLTLDFSPGEFKFRAPKKVAGNAWAVNLGIVGDDPKTITDEEDVPLEDDGANILTVGGNYTLILDVANKKFTIIENEAADVTDWTGVVLDMVGDGVSIENEGASADESSWSFGNVLKPDNEGKPSVSAGGIYTWTWARVTLLADEGFKIRTLNGEASPQNDVNFDVGYGALDIENSTDLVVDVGGNLTVSADGEYEIIFTIDAPDANKMTIVIKEYKEFPENVYMIGAQFGDFTWTDAGVIDMIPVNGVEGAFWAIRYFDSTMGFKWNTAKDWDGGDFNQLGEETVGYTITDGNAFVPENGIYIVYIDIASSKITIEPATVYGMGDVFGAWDEGAFPFTIDGSTMNITATNDGNLRMYAGFSGATSDWWTREFNVFDGKIEYRGTSDDQASVAVTVGDVITLDFNAGTGSIVSK